LKSYLKNNSLLKEREKELKTVKGDLLEGIVDFIVFRIEVIQTYTLDIIYYSRFVPLAYKNFISNLKTNAL